MASKRLHCLGGQARLDPSGNSKMSQSVPIEAAWRFRTIGWVFLIGSFERLKEWNEMSFDDVVVPGVVPFPVRKDQVIRPFEFRL